MILLLKNLKNNTKLKEKFLFQNKIVEQVYRNKKLKILNKEFPNLI